MMAPKKPFLALTVGFAALAVVLVGCGSKESSGDERSGEKGETVSTQKLVDGFWAQDVDFILGQMSEQMSENQIEKMRPRVELMSQLVIFELSDGKSIIHKPGDNEVGSFEFVSSNDETGDFEMVLNGSEKGTGNVKGDTMTMTQGEDGVPTKLTRLSREEFEKRKEAIENEPDPSGG